MIQFVRRIRSQYTKELIQQSVIESNKYTDDLVANLSNIKLDIVDALPDSSTVNKSTIYILKDSTGGANNTLNVWSDTTSTFVEVGKLSVDFTNYCTKSEVDAELVKKANADEVLKPDAIVADLTTTSGSTTLSSAGLKTELDKKANDDEVLKTTDISTTIDGTSTDNTVPTNKAVYNSLANKLDKPVVADVPWTQLTMGSGMSGDICYRIKNGICYVCVTALKSSTMSTPNQTITSNLPVPEITNRIWHSIVANDPTLGTLLVNVNSIGKMINHIGVDNATYYGSFSYPVAES